MGGLPLKCPGGMDTARRCVSRLMSSASQYDLRRWVFGLCFVAMS